MNAADPTEVWYLRLYVAGQSPKSLRAFANLKTLCEEHLPERYEIEINVSPLWQPPGDARQLTINLSMIRLVPADAGD